MEKKDLRKKINSRINFYKTMKKEYEQAKEDVEQCLRDKGIPTCYMCDFDKRYNCKKAFILGKANRFVNGAAISLTETIIKYKDRININN